MRTGPRTILRSQARVLHRGRLTARTSRELAANQTLVRLAALEPERWNPVPDSLSAGMESGDMGSMQQVLTVLSAALES